MPANTGRRRPPRDAARPTALRPMPGSSRGAAQSRLAAEGEELILRLRANGGDTASIRCRDFATVADALAAIELAVTERHALTLRRASVSGEDEEDGGMVINFGNVAWIQVAPTGTSRGTGQYL